MPGVGASSLVLSPGDTYEHALSRCQPRRTRGMSSRRTPYARKTTIVPRRIPKPGEASLQALPLGRRWRQCRRYSGTWFSQVESHHFLKWVVRSRRVWCCGQLVKGATYLSLPLPFSSFANCPWAFRRFVMTEVRDDGIMRHEDIIPGWVSAS